MGKKLTTEEFIAKAREVHGDKYDYSKVNYINCSTKVCIICPEHGEFWQKAHDHLSGCGCTICARIRRNLKNKLTKEIFVERAKIVHGDRYDYSKVEYKNINTKVCIICKTCGREFWQTPTKHLLGERCSFCYRKTQLSNTSFKEKSNIIHKYKYDYSKVEYINSKTKVCIICPEHGEFWQIPNAHLRGVGCPICKTSKGEDLIDAYLGKHNLSYKRQFNIKLNTALFSRNNLRVDFFLTDVNAIIEFNGIQHYKRNSYFHKDDNDFLLQIDRDNRLKEYCKKNKIKLIVIKYDQINKIDKILNKKLKL